MTKSAKIIIDSLNSKDSLINGKQVQIQETAAYFQILSLFLMLSNIRQNRVALTKIKRKLKNLPKGMSD